MITRREALLTMASALPAIAQKPARTKLPVLCVASGAMPGIGYAELGEIVRQIGFDGVDLAVMPGGIVEPQQAPVDEVRAFESIQGAGLQTPIITTALTRAYEPWARTVLILAGRTGVGLFRSGYTRANATVQQKRDAWGLALQAREYQIAMTVTAGNDPVALELESARALVDGLDPEWSGLALRADCFHPSSGISDAQFREAIPMVKAVSAFDYAGERHREWMPLGKGAVPFERMFALLAQSGFNGPITVNRDYKTTDEPGALSRDVEFLRKQVQKAYGDMKS